MRKITSLTALLSFVVLILNSVILYIMPQGRVAYWADWHLWGLDKPAWGNQHIIVGVLFLVAIFMHIYYNWKLIISYFKNKARDLKFFTKVKTLVRRSGYDLNQSMDSLTKAGIKFENKSQTLDPAGALQKLSAKGIPAKSDDKLKKLAEEYKLNPSDIYEIMK